MQDEMMDKWLEEIMNTSDILKACIAEEAPDDSFGWGALLGELWFSEDRPPSGTGILLTGPEGCGKHTAAAHVIRRLDQCGYETVFLNGEDFGTESAESGVPKERLSGLLDRLYDRREADGMQSGGAVCLVIEQLEACPHRRTVLRLLGELLSEYWVCREAPEYLSLFLILIADDETGIPALLRRRLHLCRMSLPDAEQRRLFLENQAEDLRHYVSFDALAADTEGMSYAQLGDVVKFIGGMVDLADAALPAEQISAFVRTQKRPEEQSAKLERLMEKAEALMEDLPQMFGSLADSVRDIPAVQSDDRIVPTTPLPDEILNTDDFLGEELKRVRNLSIRDLSSELFGEERASQLIANAVS